MRDTKIQWHPGFAAAMGLELAENRDDLIIQKEFNLNTKPLEIDLLVIKKNSDIRIDNEIGHIFKGHNIMEYKSPEDHLNIDTFYKAAAYACLYKSCGAKVDAIKADDITVSLVRDIKPLGLLQYLKKQGFLITNPYRGIYYIEGKVLFPTQIVVTRELGEDIHMAACTVGKDKHARDGSAGRKSQGIGRQTEQGIGGFCFGGKYSSQ